APILPGAEEEHLDAGLPALLVAGEEVGFLDRPRIDPLRTLDERERCNAVAINGGRLEVEPLGGQLHLLLHLDADGLAAPGKEADRLVDQLAVLTVRDDAGAGRRATLDLIEEAGPRAALVKGVGAGADQEGALHCVDRAAHRAGRGERPEILPLARAR